MRQPQIFTIWKVNRSAFDSDAEANLVDALRNGGFVEVSLVAEVDEHIVGQILFNLQQCDHHYDD